MENSTRFLVFFLFLLLFVSFGSPTGVLAQATVARQTVSAERTIPCTGETVLLEGRFQSTTNVRMDSAGGYHATDNWNFHAEGVGDQGNEYRVNYSDNWSQYVGIDELPSVWSWPEISNLVGHGQAPNVKIRYWWHVTINENGETTAYVDNYELICR